TVNSLTSKIVPVSIKRRDTSSYTLICVMLCIFCASLTAGGFPYQRIAGLAPALTVTAKFLKTADANLPGMFRLKRDDRFQGSHHPPYNGWPPLYPRVAGFLILLGTKKLISKKKQCQNRAPANSCSASVLTPFAALNGRSFLTEHL